MKSHILYIFLTFVITKSFSQSSENKYFKDTIEIDNFSEKVVKSFSKNEINETYVILREKWILPSNELDNLEMLTLKQMNLIQERYGKINGYEFVKNLWINKFVLRKVYAIKFEKHIVMLMLTYYNNGNNWLLNGFKYDDDFVDFLR